MPGIRFLLALLLTIAPAVAVAQTPARATNDEAIRAVIGRWYVEQRAGAKGRPFMLLAPAAIDASPGYTYTRRPSGMRSAMAGPRVYTSLAATALTFRHEVSQLVRDARFARARVYERAYFYAAATQATYERLGVATFVLERQDDGRWLILAHQTGTMGIPPGWETKPMPDLRALYYATAGRDRDPATDAREAARF